MKKNTTTKQCKHSICIKIHVQKYKLVTSKILVPIFCFVDIVLHGSNVSTPVLCFFSFMSLLLQIVKSRVSLIVLSVFIKLKLYTIYNFS